MRHIKKFNESLYTDQDDDGQWDDDIDRLKPTDTEEYPDVMEYLDNTLVTDTDGYTKSKSEDPEVIKQLTLGGIQQVVRSKYPQLDEKDLSRTSTLWFWRNLPGEMVKGMQAKDPGRFKFMTRFFGEHPSFDNE